MQGMEDIAPAGHAWQGNFLTSAQGRAEVGDGGVRLEATVGRFEQTHGPGIAVAGDFAAEEKAVGGTDVGPYEHRLVLLKDLIEAGDGDGGKILPSVIGHCLGHRRV